MRIELTVRGPTPGYPDRDVVVESEPGTRAEELCRRLGGSHLSVSGRPVTPRAVLGTPPLLDGALVSVHQSQPPTASGWELRVLDGPDVGLRIPLALGRSVVGRGEDAVVRLTDVLVSRRHAAFDVGPAGISLVDLGGTNGTSVCGVVLGPQPRFLESDDVLELGRSRLQLHASARDSSRAQPDGEGHLLLTAGVGAGPESMGEVQFPDMPTPPSRSPLPWLALVLPLVMAGVVAAVMRSPTMLLFGLTGPVLLLGTWLTERRRRQGERDEGELRRYVNAAHDTLKAAVTRDEAVLRHTHRALAEVLVAAETRSEQLWSGSDLEVRVGVGSRPARVAIVGDTAPRLPHHANVPVTVDLASLGVLGICGPPAAVRSAAAALLARLMTQAAPSRVGLFAVVAGSSSTLEGLAQRAPHTRRHVRPEQARALAQEVLAEVAVREEPNRVRAPPGQPLLVVLVDGWSPRCEAIWSPVVRRGPAVAVAVVATAATRSGLPSTCGAVLSVGEQPAELSGCGPVGELVADLPGDEWVCRLSRALAPLREVVEDSRSGDLRTSVRLLDLVGETDENRLTRAWSEVRGSTRMVLGRSSAGSLDIDLAVDGPHALVAGTTGAGKSELLQTLVCSLALANRPDELTFLLVDYKGGAAFRGCGRLPHVVGLVTDLDGHLSSRALTSLTAELRRRERVLASVGAATVDEYRIRRRDHADLPSLPRVVIVIDEFRVLAEELPDFVHGLVRLAAVGRSLGVHLVLATQRPGGVVSADIRANVSLRIALRVRDRVDSVDILDTPEAVTIDASTPGRAFLRGAATPLTPFQSARVTSRPRAQKRLTVTPVDQRAARTFPGESTGVPQSAPETEDPRDVDRIVAAARAAAHGLEIPRALSPWLPPLPDRVDIGSLGALAGPSRVPVGLEDDPAAQAQRAWFWRIDEGHLGVAGGGRSGRTTAALTVIGQLAAVCSPGEVHVYAMGSAALRVLSPLPHVAVVADIDDPDELRLTIERLLEVTRAGTPDARVVVVVDGWERLAAHHHGALAAELRLLLDRRASSGLRGVVTGGRSILAGQLATLFRQRLVLALGDAVELAVAGIPAKAVPVHQPSGRALDVLTHREVQVAVLNSGLQGGVAEEIEEMFARLSWRWREQAQDARTTFDPDEPGRSAAWPLAIRRLPEEVALTDLGPAPLLSVGVRESDLASCGFDPTEGDRRILLHGPPRSGRTTALETLAVRLTTSGHPVALVGNQWSPSISGRVVLTIDGTRVADSDRLIELRRAHADLAVVVDDGERLAGLPVEPVLLEIARRVDEDRGVIVVATSAIAVEGRVSALVTDLARAHTGVELWPTGMPRLPGRGLLRTPRGVERIQVARLSRQ